MENRGLVSIICPTYNCEDYIEETIRSVKAQTYTDWELIIVDDCSTDSTKDKIYSFKENDNRIKYYKLDTNSGAAVARTEAMRKASGKFMAFLDSDDLWVDTKLEDQIKFMCDNNIDFSCTAYDQIDKDSHSLNKVIYPRKKTDYNRLLLDCPVGNSTVMYNVEKMGKFEVPNIRKRNDDALWLKMLKKEKYIYGMPNVLAHYRIRPGSISINKLALIKYHWILYRNIEKLSVARSVFHIGYWGFLKLFKIK